MVLLTTTDERRERVSMALEIWDGPLDEVLLPAFHTTAGAAEVRPTEAASSSNNFMVCLLFVNFMGVGR